VFRAAVINFVGHPMRSIRIAGPALRQAIALGDVQTAALAIYVMGQAHFGAGRFLQCAEMLRGVDELLVGDHEGMRAGTTGTMSVMCLGLRIAALGAIGHFAQGMQVAARAARIAASTGRAFDRVALLFGTGSMRLRAGQAACAVSDLEEAMSLCRLHAIDSFATAVAIPLGEGLSLLGRHQEAIEILESGLAQARRLGHLSQSAQLQSQLGMALTRVARMDDAAKVAAECIQACRPYGFVFSEAISHYVLALASSSAAAPAESLLDYERACRLCYRLQAWPTLAQMLQSKAGALRSRGANRRSAAALAQQRRVVALCEPMGMASESLSVACA
jgi:tetratricopeptide (TPR) repeat protein